MAFHWFGGGIPCLLFYCFCSYYVSRLFLVVCLWDFVVYCSLWWKNHNSQKNICFNFAAYSNCAQDCREVSTQTKLIWLHTMAPVLDGIAHVSKHVTAGYTSWMTVRDLSLRICHLNTRFGLETCWTCSKVAHGIWESTILDTTCSCNNRNHNF